MPIASLSLATLLTDKINVKQCTLNTMYQLSFIIYFTQWKKSFVIRQKYYGFGYHAATSVSQSAASLIFTDMSMEYFTHIAIAHISHYWFWSIY